MSKLYFLHLCKGAQNFKVGDNVRDFYRDPFEFDSDIRELAMLDIKPDIESAYRTVQLVSKEGCHGIMNESFVICTKTGIIRGIMVVNKNNL